VPVYGCGLYAGPAGAVACTGEGEEIIKRALARSVYEAMARGVPARRAVDEATRAFPSRWDVGIIAVDRTGWGVAANRPMAWGVGGAE
jgi:L-asparaginase/beta-aspartyl-peptidase (threonine type)